MREDLKKAIEEKRGQLYHIALQKDLTSEEVVTFSCELDKLLNEAYLNKELIKENKLNIS